MELELRFKWIVPFGDGRSENGQRFGKTSSFPSGTFTQYFIQHLNGLQKKHCLCQCGSVASLFCVVSGTNLASIGPMIEVKLSQYRRNEGSVRLMIVLFVAMIGCLWAGGQKICTALANRKPTVISYSEYARTKPSASWLVLTNCRLDVPAACYLRHSDDKNGDRDEYFIPVVNPETLKEKSCVLYKTTDPSICAVLKEMDGLKTDDAVRAFVRANLERVFPRRNVSGLVAFGIDSTSHRGDLERLEKNMADNFVVLNADAQPSLAAGLGFAGAGLGLLFGLVLYVRQKSS